jgi:hypothetical protein
MAKRQQRIKGTEAESIKEINDAAEAYVDVRDQRMALTKDEVTAKEKLTTLMLEHGLETYRDEDASPPLVVTLVPGEAKVRVRSEGGSSDDEAEE